MRRPLTLAACALVTLAGAGLTVAELDGAFGDGAVDERVIREPVREIVIDAEEGDVALVPRNADVLVRVRRDHLINTPSTSHELVDGVLTLRTRCPIGFVPCRSDYHLGVPAGVTVTVDKPSGRVDAHAVGGRVVEVRENAPPLTVATR